MLLLMLLKLKHYLYPIMLHSNAFFRNTLNSIVADTGPTGSFYSPSDDEVRQSDDEGANGHQYTTHCNDLWPMELGPKVADESYHQQVTWEDKGSQKY